MGAAESQRGPNPGQCPAVALATRTRWGSCAGPRPRSGADAARGQPESGWQEWCHRWQHRMALPGVSRQLRAQGRASGSVCVPAGASTVTNWVGLGLRAQLSIPWCGGRSQRGWGWWDRALGEGDVFYLEKLQLQGLQRRNVTAARALERLLWGCSAPGDEGAGNMFCSIPPHASIVLAGERGRCWWRRKDSLACGYRLSLPMACAQCSQCLTHFCSWESESPLSPAPSRGSRCKVLPPDVLCPGTL